MARRRMHHRVPRSPVGCSPQPRPMSMRGAAVPASYALLDKPAVARSDRWSFLPLVIGHWSFSHSSFRPHWSFRPSVHCAPLHAPYRHSALSGRNQAALLDKPAVAPSAGCHAALLDKPAVAPSDRWSFLPLVIGHWSFSHWSFRPSVHCASLHAPYIYVLIALLSALLAPAASADVFVLKSGGQIEGQWANRDDRRDRTYEVRTPSGMRLKIASDQIEARIPQPRSDDEYLRIAPTFANTVEDQWRLAEWCRENNLPQQRKTHLQAILALDEQHVAARRALGYQQFRGEWQTREEFHRRQGYQLYRGRWRLVQDIEIQEEKEQTHQVTTQWTNQLRRWRADLATDKALLAWQRFEQLSDPAAVPALETMLAGEAERRAKLIYLDCLLRIGTGPAVQVLIAVALSDADEEIFFESTDRLKKLPAHLVMPPLITHLKDPANVKVNRAAYILGKVGDETIVSPLIDALVTVHRIVNRQPGGDTTTSFGSDGSVGVSRGNSIAAADVPMQNRYVLEALVELTGQNFEYDSRAWRQWYNIEKPRIFAERSYGDLRRSAE
jgi:hypothetical protein